MPFTIGGEWIPEPEKIAPKQPIKVCKEKRKGAWITLVLNLPLNEPELKKLIAVFKQRLACGGAIKETKMELQGDQVESVKKLLREMGYKIK